MAGGGESESVESAEEVEPEALWEVTHLRVAIRVAGVGHHCDNVERKCAEDVEDE